LHSLKKTVAARHHEVLTELKLASSMLVSATRFQSSVDVCVRRRCSHRVLRRHDHLVAFRHDTCSTRPDVATFCLLIRFLSYSTKSLGRSTGAAIVT
jgi:hypothetical protein